MNKLELFAKESGLKLVGFSTVWDIHSCNSLANLAKKKGTNLNKKFSEMNKEGMEGGFTLVVGRIGRSAHSATEIGIFQGVNDDLYNDQIFINKPNSKFWC